MSSALRVSRGVISLFTSGTPVIVSPLRLIDNRPSTSASGPRSVIVTIVSPSGRSTRKSAICILASLGGVTLRETDETPKPTTNDRKIPTPMGHLVLNCWLRLLIVSENVFWKRLNVNLKTRVGAGENSCGMYQVHHACVKFCQSASVKTRVTQVRVSPLGQRPNEGRSPKQYKAATARRSLASHRGGGAADFCASFAAAELRKSTPRCVRDSECRARACGDTGDCDRRPSTQPLAKHFLPLLRASAE